MLLSVVNAAVPLFCHCHRHEDFLFSVSWHDKVDCVSIILNPSTEAGHIYTSGMGWRADCMEYYSNINANLTMTF